jgi:CRISPR/Cas system-associated endoribonuclease Cas2
MPFYIVSYDLRKPDFDYQDLYDALEQWRATRVQDSVWVLCSSATAAGIFDSLWLNMHNERDRLLVTEMGGSWKSENAITKIKPLKTACDG